MDGPGSALDGPHGTYIVEPYVSVAEIQRIAILPFEVYVTDGTRHRRLELSSGFWHLPAISTLQFEISLGIPLKVPLLAIPMFRLHEH
ncbi:hypothetical protein BGW41_004208 [Actinomortierella wolfii]|nr:hypothetical protein BGW41_004208 [Actinomortierella wolfii]